MQSLRSRIIIGLIRNRHLFRLKLRREVIDENFSVNDFRKSIDRASAKMKLPTSIRTECFDIAEMKAEWIIPENAMPGKILFYIHGGGFISGSCLTHRMHVAKFALRCGMKSVLFDYRLAPEFPFPAALEDCVKAYKWLLEQGHKPADIIIGGESAGATLTLSLLLALKVYGIAYPRAAFCISPVTDLRCQAASFKLNARKDVAPKNSWTVWTSYYIAGHNPTDPLLSPLFGNYEGMPPLYICVGSHEIHLDDCINMTARAELDGVEVTLKKWDGMIHAFPILAPLFPEATLALNEICEFVKRYAKTKLRDQE
jgi:epsilon-lactone hydrolase